MNRTTIDHPSTPVKPKDEFWARVPDQGHQILLVQTAAARGLGTHVPGRSRKRVLLHGTHSEVQAAVNESARLGLLLDLRRLEALEVLLQENGLRVPLNLAKALMMAEVKVALASGKIPKQVKSSTDPSNKKKADGLESSSPSMHPGGGITHVASSPPDGRARVDKHHPMKGEA